MVQRAGTTVILIFSMAALFHFGNLEEEIMQEQKQKSKQKRPKSNQTGMGITEFDPNATGTHENPYIHGKVPGQHKLQPEEIIDLQKDMLTVGAADIIHGTNGMVSKMDYIKESSRQCAAFEIGYVFRTMEESYKKMLDMYNTTVQMGIKNTNRGHIHYLQRVEKLHWEVMHLGNMMHEIEKKYKMDTVINASGMFEDGKLWRQTTTDARTTRRRRTTMQKRSTTSWWYPLEYGFNPSHYYW